MGQSDSDLLTSLTQVESVIVSTMSANFIECLKVIRSCSQLDAVKQSSCVLRQLRSFSRIEKGLNRCTMQLGIIMQFDKIVRCN